LNKRGGKRVESKRFSLVRTKEDEEALYMMKACLEYNPLATNPPIF
jgi:hypothetical protein